MDQNNPPPSQPGRIYLVVVSVLATFVIGLTVLAWKPVPMIVQARIRLPDGQLPDLTGRLPSEIIPPAVAEALQALPSGEEPSEIAYAKAFKYGLEPAGDSQTHFLTLQCSADVREPVAFTQAVAQHIFQQLSSTSSAVELAADAKWVAINGTILSPRGFYGLLTVAMLVGIISWTFPVRRSDSSESLTAATIEASTGLPVISHLFSRAPKQRKPSIGPALRNSTASFSEFVLCIAVAISVYASFISPPIARRFGSNPFEAYSQSVQVVTSRVSALTRSLS